MTYVPLFLLLFDIFYMFHPCHIISHIDFRLHVHTSEMSISLWLYFFLYFSIHSFFTQSLSPSSNVFEKIVFNRPDRTQLTKALNNIDWEHELYQLPPELYLPFAINIIAEQRMLLIPKKGTKRK